MWGTLDPFLGLKSLGGRADFFVKSRSGRDFGEGDFSPFLRGLWWGKLTDFGGGSVIDALAKMW